MILLMGSAGAGKGTQGKLLVEKNGYSYISTGEMLRAHATDAQKTRMLAGELLDSQEIIAMVDKALEGIADTNHLILDGFPRTIAQADWILDESKKGRFEAPIVINLDASEEIVLKRLLSRGRPDDTEEAIAKRFIEHQQETMPILQHFKDNGIQVFDVNAAQSPEAVHDEVMQTLNKLA